MRKEHASTLPEFSVRNLKVGQKLLVLVLGLITPALVLLALALSRESAKISTLEREAAGVDYVPPALALIRDVQEHRRLASAVKSGRATPSELARQSAVVAADLAAIGAVDRRRDLVPGLDAKLARLQGDWALLMRQLSALTSVQSNDRHTVILAKDVGPILGAVGHASGLALDGSTGGYFLQDLAVTRLPELAERLGQARALVLSLIVADDRSQGAQVATGLSVNGVRAAAERVDEALAFVRQGGSGTTGQLDAASAASTSATTALLDSLVDATGARGVGSLNEPRFTALATAAIDAQFATADAVVAALRDDLSRRLSSERRSRQILLLAVLAGVLIAGFLAISVARRLTRTVHLLDAAYAKVRDGDYSVQVPVESRDELGRLSSAFNDTVQDLARQRDDEAVQLARAAEVRSDANDYAAFARRVADGDLTSRMSIRESGELAELGRALNAMVDSLGRLSGEVRGASGELAGATSQILSVVRQHSSATSEQAASIAQTTVAVNEVRASAEQAAARARDVAATALRAVDVAESGTNAVDEVISGIAVIRARVEAIAAEISALSTQTTQIDEITRSVSDIADQSNMLALNATIEAAKAGEHGRGFAVVANEVRLLAEQSKAATLQVRELLSEVERATCAAVDATEIGAHSANVGVERARAAGEAIEHLSSVVRDTASSADAIAAAAREQAVGMDEINRAIAGVSTATEEIAGGANETEDAAAGLSTLAEYLGALTNQFQVGDLSAGGRSHWRDERLDALEADLRADLTGEEASALVARHLAAAFSADCALVARFDGETAVPLGAVLPPGQHIRNFSLSGRSGLATVHRTGSPVRIRDYRKLGDDGTARVARAGDYRSGVASPIRVDGAVWGGVLVATRGDEQFPLETEMFLANAAAILAGAVVRAKAAAHREPFATA